jgi:serine/threonine protein kinase
MLPGRRPDMYLKYFEVQDPDDSDDSDGADGADPALARRTCKLEADTMERLRGVPGVAQGAAENCNDTPPSLATVLVPGVSVATLLARPPMCTRVVTRVYQSLLKVVGHLEAKGVVHNDLTSHNVMYDRESDGVVLLDFDAACWLPDGTYPCSPDEGARFARSPDPARFSNDRFALGLLLLEMDTGIPLETTLNDRMRYLHARGETPDPRAELHRILLAAERDITQTSLRFADASGKCVFCWSPDVESAGP